MKTLVLWADDRSANLGVRVLAQGATELVRSALGATTEIIHQDFGPNEAGFNPGKRAVLEDIGRRSGELKEWIRSFDLVVDTGAGDSLTDIYGIKRLSMMFYTQRLAIKQSVPMVMLPQTIGPFNSRLGRSMGRYVLRGAKLVGARDSTSFEYARKEMGVDPVLATDLVFALPKPASTRPSDVLLNVSGLLWNENPHVDYREYRAALAQVCHQLRDRGRDLTLFPHVLDNPYPDNDVRVIDDASRFLGIDSVSIPEDLGSAREIVAGARLVIGSRMHACLNAISVGTPSVPLSYSRKFAPLFGNMGWPLVVDLRSHDVAAQTMMAVDRASHESAQSDLRSISSGAADVLEQFRRRLVETVASYV